MMGAIKQPVNPALNQAREIKRDAIRQIMSQQQASPRPLARPPAPPQRVMPARPAPVRPAAGAVKPAAPPPASAIRQAMQRTAPPPPPAKPSLTAKVAATVGAVTAGAAAGSLLALNTAAAHPQVSTEAAALQSSWADLQERSAFTRLQTDITNLDTSLNNVMNLLESARSKGYAFQKDLEEIAYQAMDRWQTVRPQALNTIQQNAQAMQGRLWPVNTEIQRLNGALTIPAAATPLLSTTHTQINGLLNEIGQLESSIKTVIATSKPPPASSMRA
jgi:hypothetical protein